MTTLKSKKSQSEAFLAAYKETWHRAMAEIGAGRSAQGTIGELAGELRKLQKMVLEAEHLVNIAISADAAAGKRPTTAIQGPPLIAPRRRALTQSERSDAIKKVATELAQVSSDQQVNVRDVAKAVEAKGIKLDTPVPGTMIGNVLNKSDAWKRLDRGVYKFAGSQE